MIQTHNLLFSYIYFLGNPLCQATKRHLTVKRLKTMKNETRNEITYLFLVGLLCSCPVLGRSSCKYTTLRCMDVLAYTHISGPVSMSYLDQVKLIISVDTDTHVYMVVC